MSLTTYKAHVRAIYKPSLFFAHLFRRTQKFSHGCLLPVFAELTSDYFNLSGRHFSINECGLRSGKFQQLTSASLSSLLFSPACHAHNACFLQVVRVSRGALSLTLSLDIKLIYFRSHQSPQLMVTTILAYTS